MPTIDTERRQEIYKANSMPIIDEPVAFLPHFPRFGRRAALCFLFQAHFDALMVITAVADADGQEDTMRGARHAISISPYRAPGQAAKCQSRDRLLHFLTCRMMMSEREENFDDDATKRPCKAAL